MSKKTIFITAAFIAAFLFLFLAALPAYAECEAGYDPTDPECRLSPFQSQQVNPDAISGDGSTGSVSSGGSGASAPANDMPLVSEGSLESSNSSSSDAGNAGDQKSETKGQEPKTDGAAEDGGEGSETEGQEPNADGAAEDSGQKSEPKGQGEKTDSAAEDSGPKSEPKDQGEKTDGAAEDSGLKSETKDQEEKTDGAAEADDIKSETKGQEPKAAPADLNAEESSSTVPVANESSLDIRMRYQSSDPRDASGGAFALGMALDGLDGNGPTSSALIDFLIDHDMLDESGTSVEELASAAAEFGYDEARPFHGATFDQLRAELAAGRPVVVALGASGEGVPAHFVTVTGISPDGQRVFINDPLLGQRTLSRAEFEALWELEGTSGVGFGAGAGVAGSNSEALPWLAFGAGLMAVLSSTPTAVRRKGIGGRVFGGGSTNLSMRPPYSAPAGKRWKPQIVNSYETVTVPGGGTKKVEVGTVVGWELVDEPPPTPPPTETPPPTATPEPTTLHPGIAPQSTPSPEERPTPEAERAPYPPTLHPGIAAGSTPSPTEQPTPDPEGTPYPPGYVPSEPEPLTVPLTGGSVRIGGKLAKWVRRFNKMRAALPLRFVRQADGKVTVRVGPRIPPGSKIHYRSAYNIAGTRYNPSTLASIKASNLMRGARSNSALGLSLGVSTAVNLYDYGIGENKDTGIASPEFAASTMVDFAIAGITGLTAAGTVAAALTGAAALGITAAATAPVWVTIGAVGVVGAGISYGISRVVDVPALKQDVADGIRAWDGIADNAGTIARVAVDQGRDFLEEAGQSISRGVTSLANSLFGGGS